MIETKEKWVPLKFDLMAKKIFGDNNNKGPIKFLLNQILGITPKDVKVLNNEIVDRPYKDKKFEVDLLVVTDDNITIGVEINTNISKAIINRNLFYMCMIMSRDLKPREDFSKLNKHIQISFDFIGRQERPIMSYKLMNKETLNILSDKMEIVKISVPYFYERYYNEDASLQERFIGLFNEEDSIKAKKLIKGDKNMEEIYDEIVDNSDDEMIGLYDIESHRREIERTSREEAIEEGIQQGIEQNTISIAKNMLKANTDINFISEVTGLSTDEIRKLNTQ